MDSVVLLKGIRGHAGDVDGPVVVIALLLLLAGFVAISSASIDYALVRESNALHYSNRHLIYVALALFSAAVVYSIPVKFWFDTGWIWLFVSLIMLSLVLVPHIGRGANGSQRWLALGPLTLQVSEFAKMFLIIYLAGYLQRRQVEVRSEWSGFIKPMAVVFAVTLLLMAEPDFGATVVTVGTAFGMLFLAGVRVGHFLAVALASGLALAILVVSEPYRLARLLAYRNPWEYQFDSGYQLTQSLIAFGRGEWFGVGLGNSIQKLFYLPEAHTDFVFSIWAEETGLLGTTLILALYLLLVLRILWISRRVAALGDLFGAFVCQGVALVLSAQVFINIGVATGLLPTKGLTLPLISYGGSSLIACCCMLALVLRIDHHHRRGEGGVRGR